ncbi:MAG: toll/interleukin-1 receptor domain-containing protein [Steroidobacteraceae bacterium]
MSDPESSIRPRPTVFLSYASEDRRAAQVIRDALPAFGLEVWYDESELVGGDAWDQKIRRQIRECTFFMPVISSHTEARHEGYFRREWRLAVERTLDMADDHVFLLPVVVDSTVEAGARVPEKFRAVQWLRLPDGQPTAALEALCRRLVGTPSESRSEADAGRAGQRVSREVTHGDPGRGAPEAASPETASGKTRKEFPEFPREEPGQRVRFWFQVAGWLFQSAWAAFLRLPRWVRIAIYCWLAILLMARGCTPSDHDRSPRISSSQAEKLREIGASHPGNWTAADTTQLLTQIAKEIPAAAKGDSSTFAPVLAIPFAASAGDATAQKLAAAVFTQVYGQLAIARHGQVALADQPLPTLDASTAMAQGHAHASSYVVYGAVSGSAPDQQLTIKIITANDGSVLWSKSYPTAGADPDGIAAEVSAHVPRHDED